MTDLDAIRKTLLPFASKATEADFVPFLDIWIADASPLAPRGVRPIQQLDPKPTSEKRRLAFRSVRNRARRLAESLEALHLEQWVELCEDQDFSLTSSRDLGARHLERVADRLRGGKRKAGRGDKGVLRLFVIRLAKIYAHLTGRRPRWPTRDRKNDVEGPFYRFCEAAFTAAGFDAKEDPSIDLVIQALEEAKKGRGKDQLDILQRRVARAYCPAAGPPAGPPPGHPVVRLSASPGPCWRAFLPPAY